MIPEEYDPLAQVEHSLRGIHDSTHRRLRFVQTRYPLLFLFLITFSVAALFHGLDALIDQFSFLKDSPLLLVLIGVLGLFLTGTLYRRLGKDKYDS